jgi:toxin FitB
MRFLLDTNVLSEPAKPNPEPRVVAWMRSQSTRDISISVLTLGEIAKGVSLLANGSRRKQVEAWLTLDLPRQFAGRVLHVDPDVAIVWGRLSAEGRRSGRELPVIDGLLLATANVHDLTLVTRNENDCRDRGVSILNPWVDS